MDCDDDGADDEDVLLSRTGSLLIDTKTSGAVFGGLRFAAVQKNDTS